MRKWQETERRKAADRHAEAAATPSTDGIPKRLGREGGKRVKGGEGGASCSRD